MEYGVQLVTHNILHWCSSLFLAIRTVILCVMAPYTQAIDLPPTVNASLRNVCLTRIIADGRLTPWLIG